MKCFNVTGTCVGSEHYMVDISKKLDEIEKLVERRQYFTINRARQYGKTTTLFELARRLKQRGGYTCALISFETMGLDSFETEKAFCDMFLGKISRALISSKEPEEYAKKWRDESVSGILSLSDHITNMCMDRKFVLMIDEVDKSSNNRMFLHFLGLLREKFQFRQQEQDYTFHSVILAGVTDIKNLKLKIINDGNYSTLKEEGRIANSPWNIAADFDVEMSFCTEDISLMLQEYEMDNKTGMDITVVANGITTHTNGYPFLVSRICKHIDEKLDKNWSPEGVEEAVRVVLGEVNVLFDDMAKNLRNFKNLHDFMYEILIVGETKMFNIDVLEVSLANAFGYIKKMNGSSKIAVSNRIFEIRMTHYFAAKDENVQGKRSHGLIYQDVIKDGKFDMAVCLTKFAKYYREIYSEIDNKLLERHGRLLFLSFLTPLLNGQGFFHIETQLTDLRRMDIVVDFERHQQIVELKMWKGEAARKNAYDQLLGYMETKNATEGFMLTFDFRKRKTKKYIAKWVEVGGRRIFDVVV